MKDNLKYKMKNENNDDELIKFIEENLCLKPTQIALMKHLIRQGFMRNERIWFSDRRYKKLITNELTSDSLLSMKINQTFGLVSPEGLRIFKLEKIIQSKVKGKCIDYIIGNETGEIPEELYNKKINENYKRGSKNITQLE